MKTLTTPRQAQARCQDCSFLSHPVVICNGDDLELSDNIRSLFYLSKWHSTDNPGHLVYWRLIEEAS